MDSSRAPIFEVRFPPNVTDAELLDYFTACETWSKSVTSPVGWVIDLSNVVGVTAKQRALFAEYQERQTAFDRRYTRAAGLVVANSVVRGFVTAVYWLKPPVYQYDIFGRREEALRWVARALSQKPLS